MDQTPSNPGRLKRAGISRPARPVREPVNSYEWPCPGDLTARAVEPARERRPRLLTRRLPKVAIATALFFGLGFGRVLQLVHARAWRLALPSRQTDFALYALVLLSVYGLILLLLIQLTELHGAPHWVGLTLSLGWIGLLVLFFVWAPWLLTDKLVTRRDLLP